MKKLYVIFISFFLVLGIAGCAGPKPLSEQAMFQQYPKVAQLKRELDAGFENELNVLSPAQYRQAKEIYEESVNLGKIDNAKASTLAQSGMDVLQKARQNASKAEDILEEVLRARAKAKKARAEILNTAAFAEAEAKLKSLTGLIEAGREAKAKAGLTEAMRTYEAVELAALKGNIVDVASDAIAKAKKKGVDDLAPKTMKLAQEEYRLAVNTLNVDRTSTPKARTHAQRALWNTQRATQIAEVITHFDQSDFNEEDKVLWYQEQISRIVAPIESDLAFNEPNKELVKNLANKLQEMQSQQESTLAALQKTKEREMQISQAKEAALTEVMSLNEQKRQQQAALAARFSRVQSLFDPSEADVYRQMDNVLIRAHGFSFPSGSSEIESENFALINKIVEAIEQFPESRILVSGHTDNVGSDPFNKSLSQQRADKVAKFLREVGRIDAGRLASKGYGKERPVAPNETAEGRAANRRVEVLIINNPDSVDTVGQIPADIDR